MADKTIIGLDIGSTKLRLVEVLIKGDKSIIKGAASYPLPDGTIVDSQVADKPALIKALKSAYKEGKFTGRELKVAINSKSNFVQELHIEDDKDFDKILPFKLKKEVDSKLLEKSTFKYHTLDKYIQEVADESSITGKKLIPMRKIFLVGTDKQFVADIIECIESADLRVISIDLAPFALIRSSLNNSSEDSEKFDIHINIGGETTPFIISNNGQPLFLRPHVGSSGNILTSYLMQQLKVSRDKAETLKRHAATMDNQALSLRRRKEEQLNPDLNEESGFGDDLVPEDKPESRYSMEQIKAYELVNEAISGMLKQIIDSVNYFIDHKGSNIDNINSITLSGGTANFPQFITRLSNELDVKDVKRATPFTSRIEVGLADKLPAEIIEKEFEYATAVGVATGQGA